MKIKWVVLILAIIAVGTYVYLHYKKSSDFEPLIKNKLANLVSKASNGLYQLKMETIEIDLLQSTITVKNVSLTIDTARMIILEKNKELPDDIYTATLKKLHIKGIAPQDFLNAKNISLSQILLDSPVINITHKKRNEKKPDTGNFYSRISPKNESYNLKNLLLQNIQLTYKNLDKNNLVSTLQNLTAVFDDIKIDATTIHDSSRFLFAKEAVIYLKNYSTSTADKMYSFSIDSIILKPQKGSLQARSIRLKPLGTKDDFSSRVAFLKDRFDIYFKEASIKNISWWSLVSNENFIGDSMNIQGGYISVYNDRRLPSSGISKVGNYPHQLLMKLNLPVKMNVISIGDVDVVYEEFNPQSDKPGSISFNHAEGTIWNISNMPEQIAADGWMKVKVKAMFMNEANIDAAFNFDLNNTANGNFNADALLAAMDGKKLNRACEGLGLVQVETLQIDKMEAHIKGTNDKADGRIIFAYHNLKIAALKKEQEGKMKKRALITYIANTFILKKNSPATGNPIKEYVVSLQRNTDRSFFNLIWKTICEGAIQSVKGK